MRRRLPNVVFTFVPLLWAPADAQTVPLPALQFSISVPWTPVYAGDPIRVRARLASPRAQQEARRAALARERGLPPAVPSFQASPLSQADLTVRAGFQLYRILEDGTRKPVLSPQDWVAQSAFGDAGLQKLTAARQLGIVALLAEWTVSPDAAGSLPESEYELEAAWDGLPAGLDRLSATPVRFKIVAAATDDARAIHEYRLGYYASLQGQNDEAKKHALESLRLGQGVSPSDRIAMLLLAGETCEILVDYQTARASYTELLTLLPPPEMDDLASSISQKLDRLRGMN